MNAPMKIGLIVNPIAGMGGKVGLKGTDGEAALKKALQLGAVPVASERAEQALQPLALLAQDFTIITCSGEMGENACISAGLTPSVVIRTPDRVTTKLDTMAAVGELVNINVSLILFAGGDGTAGDVFAALQGDTPILGIPAGVKMHSAVFATSPGAASRLILRLLREPSPRLATRQAEIMDISEQRENENSHRTKLLGYASVPTDRRLIQNPKSYGTPDEQDSIQGIAKYLEDNLNPCGYYIIGPGQTTQIFLKRLGVQGTLLGVDVIRGKELIDRDVNHKQLITYSRYHPLFVIVSVIGGQGFLFGRGNQQITSDILEQVGKDNIIVISTAEKLASLDRLCLLVDTGDKKMDAALSGYIRVRVDERQTLIVKVDSA
jgi:predicted polyphosphate/ATP-dependent NAD kinase